MVLIKSFLTEALYNRSKLFYGYSNEGDKVGECYSCLKFMIQTYLRVDFLKTFFIKHVSLKGTVMQIEKPLINDRLRVSKVS